MKSYGLYIHIPFCKSKCRYCGFYSDCYDIEVQKQYIIALIDEMRRFDCLLVDTIYIGGGTPSVLRVDEFEELLKNIYSIFKTSLNEFTVEMNPESVSVEKLKILKDYNVNRISLGVQSLSDKVLNFLGRIHSSKDAKKAIEDILNVGFSLNCDIIYDIPQVERTSYFNTIKELSKYPIEHISAYNYSFDTEYLKEFKDKDTETCFLEVIELLESIGFKQYEISNFAKNGNFSRHNIKYWQMDDYIGVGISAHSMKNFENFRLRSSNEGSIFDYINKKHKISKYEVSLQECLIEDIIFGIRMVQGLKIECLKLKYGEDSVNSLLEKVEFLWYDKFLEDDEGVICLTKKGQLFLDSVQQSFWDAFFS